MAMKMETGLGDVVVDKIKEEVLVDGGKVIKVMKKRLVKKEKPKRKKGQLVPQEEGTPFDYVRVNQINVFDYDNEFDEPEEKEKVEE